MAENNQLSDETKINSTNTSSTDDSSAVIGNHENAVVPHKISNHDKLVQTMVMVDGEWINVNDTNDQANVKYDMHKVNKKVVEAQKGIVEAKNSAESAVKYADSAVSASKVNSDAIAAQSSAIIEAKSAMDSATAEIQQLKANAASDVAQIRADVAQVQNEVDTAKAANSASVDKLKSDIGLAQKDLDNVHDSLTKAQSAVEQNQKLINDSVTKINSDIAQSRQDIITAQQANNDLTKQLDTYSKEAQEQGKTIKTIQDNQDGFSITIADVKGDVTKVSDTVDGLSAGLKDAQGNIASVKAQADQLNVTLTDHSKNINQLIATAKELSSTLKDADGRLSKVEQTAKEHSSTLSGLQGNLTQVRQTADNLVTTLKDAQGNIDQIKQDAKGTLEQLSNAQGDITALQKDVSDIKLTIADHDKNIHTLQADSKTLKDDMADAKGNISSLQKTSTSLVSEFKDHDGRLGKVEQTATEHTSELADTKGNVDKVTQKANTLQLLLSDAQKNIQNIQLDAKGLHDTITGQSNQLASLNVTLNSLDSKYSGITGELQSKQTALSTEQQQTKDMLLRKADKSEVDNVKGTVNQVSAEQKTMADQINQKVSSIEYQTLKDKVNGMKIGTRNLLHHSDTFDGWHKGASVSVSSNKYLNGNIAVLKNTGSGGTALDADLDGPYDNQPISWAVYAKADNAGDKLHTELWGGGGFTDQPLTTEWQVYKFTGQRDARGHSLYLWGCQGNKGNIYVALPFAVVGNYIGTWLANPDDTIAAISKNTTAIDENSKAIKLKADATEVNNLKGTVNSHSASINLFSDQLKNMVTESKVNDIINGKGFTTQSTVQSLIDQKAGTLNESIVNLTSKVNGNNGGGINLLNATDFSSTDLNKLKDVWGSSFTLRDGCAMNVDARTLNSRCTDALQTVKVEPDTDYTLSFEVYYSSLASGGSWNSIQTFLWEFQDAAASKTTAKYTDNARSVVNTNKRNDNIQTIHTQPDCHFIKVIFRANPKTQFSFIRPKLERGSVATPWSPAPSDLATVTQIQSVTASIDGLQSAVTNYQKDASSKYTQLSDLMQSKVNKGELESVRTQLASSINERIQKGNLITQFNLEAGRALIQSNKIYFDADSFVMSPNSKAFIPSAYITNINADKITTGTLDAAKFNVRNFSANNITGGTLKGVVVKTGANDRYFQTSKDNIYWVRNGSMSLVGNDTYLNSANGLNIADENNIQLTTWGGATVNKDGSITNNSGNSGHPKIIIDPEGKYNPDDIYGSAFGGGPGNSEIAQWVGNKEYTALTRGKGFTIRLNDGNNNSKFSIQKDNKVGFYVGQGENGNQVNVLFAGDGSGFNVHGNFNVYGAKNSAVKTSQGDVAVSAYETAEYYFGDIGEGQTGDSGIAFVGIEKLFSETVNTSIPYQVFITAYGPGNLWVDQREHDRFVVKSDRPNVKFGWEIKAKRRGYENTRLQKVN